MGLRIHIVEKEKDYISSNKSIIVNELSKTKYEKDKKTIHQSYKHITSRDSKLVRNKWNSCDDMNDYSMIEEFTDPMIDKIVSLHGFTIKSKSHRSLSEIRYLLLAIVDYLSATSENCTEMHQYCPTRVSSRCHYQNVMFLGGDIPSHPRTLFQKCTDRVLAIMAPYMSLEYLDRVKGGRTSNLKEVLHQLIWTSVSKTQQLP
ncbi:hypothetical protein LOD99_2213 [Oopsacas minuta]|uniref:Uncharacterized protein n=1 Tax=Oopsacas minuta TaxID=111878 RepID=A0AAV7K2B8_9METZ|nr:hypothetical protein LOD99_2213 [Oopsacas minuta]